MFFNYAVTAALNHIKMKAMPKQKHKDQKQGDQENTGKSLK